MKNFRDLKVLDKAHQLALEIYRATNDFSKHELYGVTSQIRRAATSIPTNVAEGCGSRRARHIGIRQGSRLPIPLWRRRIVSLFVAKG